MLNTVIVIALHVFRWFEQAFAWDFIDCQNILIAYTAKNRI